MRLKAEGPKILQIGPHSPAARFWVFRALFFYLYNFRFCVVVDEAEAEDFDNF